jgi:hypothetical protein
MGNAGPLPHYPKDLILPADVMREMNGNDLIRYAFNHSVKALSVASEIVDRLDNELEQAPGNPRLLNAFAHANSVLSSLRDALIRIHKLDRSTDLPDPEQDPDAPDIPANPAIPQPQPQPPPLPNDEDPNEGEDDAMNVNSRLKKLVL